MKFAMSSKSTINLLAAVLIGALAVLPVSHASAEETPLATVNGKPITEQDLAFAEAEIGSDLGNLPGPTRRRVLVEYIIETQLMADAASAENLDKAAGFDERMAYYKRKALREAYFDGKIKNSISEAAAKAFYDDQIKGMKPEEEVKARHILVETEDKAREIKEQIAHGADFAEMAKEHSKDPGTKDNGGLLGFFSRGQMVPQFEEAAFMLEPGDVSEPVQSRFGWHLIMVEERREKPLPTFDQVKERILNSMIHRKAQSIGEQLRSGAKIEYIDPEIKKEVAEQEEQAAKQRKLFEQQIQQLEAQEKAKAEKEKAGETGEKPAEPAEGQKEGQKSE